MNFASLNSEENKNYLMETNILSAFGKQQERGNQIQQGMSPKEIAEVVSDHLIGVVREQFETAKKEFHAKEKK